MDVRGRQVVVMGLGASGRAAAMLACAHGALVTGLDLRTDLPPIEGVRLELGPHNRQTFLNADIVVVSPGVPATQAHLVAARENGAVVVGELGFAWSFLEAPKAIAVTGTNGKSTVTWFVGQLLEHAGISAFVGGNLGTPLSESVRLGEQRAFYVIEVSSYQLELPGTFAPQVGAILNITPDHLKRHGTMARYGAEKARLFERMVPADFAVTLSDDPLITSVTEGVGQGKRVSLGAFPGVVRRNRVGTVQVDARTAQFDLSEVAVAGEHNLDNALTAALLLWLSGIDAAAIQRGLSSLVSLEHRMEIVPTQDGRTWINDSKATNIDATRVGVSGLDSLAVVLLGGAAKAGGGFASLVPQLAQQRAVITFGGSGDEIAAELAAAGLKALQVNTLEDAVAAARKAAQAGDIVLLSPGCASFDAFDNFEHRGRVFRDLATGRSP